MSKTRSIKPETFTDAKVLRITPLARWLFIGLWTEACDNGHVDDNEIELKVRLLPADNCNINDLLEELEDAELVTREGGVITVPNLSRHQSIDRRYFKTCDAPGCCTPGGGAVARPARRAHAVHTPGTRRAHAGDTTGKRGTRINPDWYPTQTVIDTIKNEYPNLDLRAEHNDFTDYWLGVSGQRGTKLDWDATWRKWMRKQGREQEAKTGYRNQSQIVADNITKAQARDAQRDEGSVRALIDGAS